MQTHQTNSRFTTVVGQLLLNGAVLACLIGAATQDKDPDLQRLQGTWRVESMESSGRVQPQDNWKHFAYTFKDHTLHFLGDTFTPGADLWMNVTLDPNTRPGQIDLTFTKTSDGKDVGKVIKGIYRFVGEKLELCCGDGQRPKEFKTAKDDGCSLIVFVRKP